jgi:hypothetical protein
LPAGGSVDLTTKQLLELGTKFKQQFSQTHLLGRQKAQLLAHRDPSLLAGKQLINLSKYPPIKTLLAGKSGAFYFAGERGVKWLSCLN